MKIMLLLDAENKAHVNMLLPLLSNNEVFMVQKSDHTYISQYKMQAERKGCTNVIVSHTKVLQALVSRQGHDHTKATLSDYAGSVFHDSDINWLIIDKTKNIYGYEYGRYQTETWINKLTQEKRTPKESPFTYIPWDSKDNMERLIELSEMSVLTGVDVETILFEPDPEKLAHIAKAHNTTTHGMWTQVKGKNSKKLKDCIPIIDMVGYTFIIVNNGKLESYSTAIPFDSSFNLEIIRRFNRSAAPKVMQNGGYDSTYFLRFNCPLHNYIYDTYTMMHSWLVEMPRDLGYIGSLFLHSFVYWKDEITEKRAEYCAKDTYVTAWAFLIMQKLAPTWARRNYVMNFKQVFPNMTCGADGFKVDTEERDRLAIEYKELADKELESLQKMVGGPFNPNSSPQVLKLFNAINFQKVEATDKIELRKLSDSHPLNRIMVDKIQTVREARKKISTYINATLFCDRLLYEVNSCGTDTGRDASKASNLWVGTQVQNLDNKMRSMYLADDGYVLCSSDGAQAESRTTAYISEDFGLIDAVEHSPDFHSKNCSLFFGVPFDEIWDVEAGKAKNKKLRDLSKRTNHGANYNMSQFMLMLTMGPKYVQEAKRLLGLPAKMRLLDVCEYLLNRFDDTYPSVRGKYYDEVIQEVLATGRLTIPCDEIPWTRLTFKRPSRDKKNKKDLNELVAHMPQGLSAKIIQRAWYKFWREWQILREVVRVKAPIHDEIVYQCKPDHPQFQAAGQALSEYMSAKYTVRGRTLVIPCDFPVIGKRLSEVKG